MGCFEERKGEVRVKLPCLFARDPTTLPGEIEGEVKRRLSFGYAAEMVRFWMVNCDSPSPIEG
jgi:hypothetical protein